MTSYILKNETEEKKVLLFQNKQSYSFKPNKKYKIIENITVLDLDMLNSIWEEKIEKEYKKLLAIFYEIIGSEDDASGAYIPYKEIDRIREYLLSLEQNGLKKSIIDKYLKKLYFLELEFHNLNTYEEVESKGCSR